MERLRFQGATERGGYQKSDKFDENGEFGESGDLTKFLPERLRFKQASKRGRYQESSKFDKNGEFGEIGKLMKFHEKDLDLRK